MTKWLRENGIVMGLFAIKLLTTARTGIDTYHVSHDMLNVLLIDGVFLALWLVAAYGGQSTYMMTIRPFASAVAWALYIGMVVIGWEASHTGVAFVARLAGGAALLYDTYGYVTEQLRRWGKDIKAKRLDTAAQKHLILAKRVRVAQRRSGRKLQAHIDTMLFERMRDDLKGGVLLSPPDAPPTQAERTAITVSIPTAERRRQVQALVDKGDGVTVTALATRFDVSRTTIYNDLDRLDISL